ncbi:MAG: DUF1015 domain-containing protein [Oscillospiraceae bacterium]|nr:DUF1015 domain-containing protein [Oscillospiraceae bacterium]
MAVIKPFAALRYDYGRAGAAETLCCPPYDVISPDVQAEMERQNPYNVIRLERPLGNDRYAEAGRRLRAWLRDGVLYRDPAPAYYVYRLSFDDRGVPNAVHGFFARVRLTDFAAGIVLPHEETLSKDKSDRFSLMEHTLCNISPVYALYEDGAQTAEAVLAAAMDAPPAVRFTDSDGVTHEMWPVTAPDTQAALTAALAPERILIADGHHRYETALAFRDARRAADPSLPPEAPSDHIMMMLVNLHHPGLVVWPTHRLVRRLPSFSEADTLARLADAFEITHGIAPEEVEAALAARPHMVALYAGGGEAALLTLRDTDAPARLLPDRSPDYRALDVTLLHTMILAPLFGIDRDNMARQENLVYTRSLEEALGGVRSGAFQCAFLLAPTPVSAIGRVAGAGERMPQKSTYFYPKLTTGLVIHPLSIDLI